MNRYYFVVVLRVFNLLVIFFFDKEINKIEWNI